MAKLVALYRTPTDPAAFDRYYASTHAPLARTLPGLRSYEISVGSLGTPQGESPWHLAAILSFDSTAAIQHALASPAGQATAGDLANFAQPGVELLVFESEAI